MGNKLLNANPTKLWLRNDNSRFKRTMSNFTYFTGIVLLNLEISD